MGSDYYWQGPFLRRKDTKGGNPFEGAYFTQTATERMDKEKIQPPELPEAPSPDESAMKAQDIARRKRANKTKTIYTDPLGIYGEADLIRKTLLGE